MKLKKKVDITRQRLFIKRVTRNKIKNDLKAQGVIARRQERERKRKLQELQKANQFVLVELYEAIPDPEKLVTNKDIELQLREAFISIERYNIASTKEPTTSNAKARSNWDTDFIAFDDLDSQYDDSMMTLDYFNL